MEDFSSKEEKFEQWRYNCFMLLLIIFLVSQIFFMLFLLTPVSH
ncbi:hypothetical protein [Anaerovibrio sp.]|nr:hypothetical protein [Anaerovibrio sp.]